MTAARIALLGLIGIVVGELSACGGTHTGNPGEPPGTDFVRSELKREVKPDVSTDDRQQLEDGNQDFAFDMYAQLASDPDHENLLLSPYSLSVGMAMTYAGAKGETKAEIGTVCHFDLEEPALHRAFNAASQELETRSAPVQMGNVSVPGAQLSVANAAFTQQDTDFRPDYLDLLALNYDAGMYRLDFVDSEGSRKRINDWTAEHTAHRITNLLPEGSIDPATRLALVNAVYFKAAWLERFSPDHTQDGRFHAGSGDVDARMMRMQHPIAFAEGDGYQAVELAFVPDSLRMLIILPSEGRFDEVQGKLDRGVFAAVRQQLQSEIVLLTMPRFTFDSAFELRKTLGALGMQRAFVVGPGPNSADFTPMADTAPPLYVSEVFHKTFIAVQEEGVEAAAATATLGTTGTSKPEQPIEVTLDRPFLFAIYDEPTGQILFLGRLLDPS